MRGRRQPRSERLHGRALNSCSTLLRRCLVFACCCQPVSLKDLSADEAGSSAGWERAPISREAPSHLNCTANRFIDVVLRSVTRQLRLSGVAATPKVSLDYHFDAGRSQPEGGGRAIPGPVTIVNATEAAGPHCSPWQLAVCAQAIGGLISLEGLGEYLASALERGVAQPTPEAIEKLGWGAVGEAVARSHAAARAAGDAADHPIELGGGSGAGFQVICGDKGLASLGGGGGGGLFGSPGVGSALGVRPHTNDSVGGGGGGGAQLFFPVNESHDPWSADRWFAWGSGGGGGCGSCNPGLPGYRRCLKSARRVSCGAKMDDNGNPSAAKGQEVAYLWRAAVLRRCYEAGRLAIIGGGGGGSGGGRCCHSIPALNFGFGFHATLRPPEAAANAPSGGGGQPEDEGASGAAASCCPDLARWNVTNMGKSSSGSGSVAVVARLRRRLTAAAADAPVAAAGDAPVDPFENPGEYASIDPFTEENHGPKRIHGANRRPELDEMIKQHAKRMGVSAEKVLNWTHAPTCKLPAWLNFSAPDADLPPAWMMANSTRTSEPMKAMRYIYRYNPLQGYLADAAQSHCTGWGDWCCVCHEAQRRIACLPEDERQRVEWFLTEDCCESALHGRTRVEDVMPARNTTIAWHPRHGWMEFHKGENISDSYEWTEPASHILAPACPIMDVETDGHDVTVSRNGSGSTGIETLTKHGVVHANAASALPFGARVGVEGAPGGVPGAVGGAGRGGDDTGGDLPAAMAAGEQPHDVEGAESLLPSKRPLEVLVLPALLLGFVTFCCWSRRWGSKLCTRSSRAGDIWHQEMQEVSRGGGGTSGVDGYLQLDEA